MLEKMMKIRKLYELAVERENTLVDVYDAIPNSMDVLKQVSLESLHIATKEVETLKKVLDILQ